MSNTDVPVPPPNRPNPGNVEYQADRGGTKPRRRVFLWVFMAVQALFIIWIITGIASGGGSATDCGSLDQETCDAAENIGTGLGVAAIIIFWMVVDFLLAVIYGIYRLAKRT